MAEDNVVSFMMEGARQRRQNAIGTSLQEAFDQEADPARAGEALQLSEDTGAPPATVEANLDQFKQNYKAQLMSELIKNNQHLQDYANSHPLASKVSANDWHNLDEWSELMKKIPKSIPGPIGTFAQKLVESVAETAHSFASIPENSVKWNPATADLSHAIEKLQKEGVTQGNVGQLLSTVVNVPIEAGAALPTLPYTLYSGGEVNQGIKDLIGGLFGVMGTATGIIPAVKTGAQYLEDYAGVSKELTEPLAFLGMMAFGLKPAGKQHHIATDKIGGGPFLRAGKLPPPGLHPEADAIREQISKENLKSVEDATKAAQASETTQIAPSFAEQYFARPGVKGQSVRVNVDAVRRLYGDKVPTPDDGILGWVKDLQEQIESQAPVGGDIRIPLESWMVRIDPEIAKVLKDDTKIGKDDITANEAKELKEQREAEEALKELEEESKPKEPEFDEEIPEWSGKPPDTRLGPTDMSRRGFLKGVGATATAAATGKVPKVGEFPPIEIKPELAANLEGRLASAVQDNLQSILSWVEEWTPYKRDSKEGQAIAIQALEEGAKSGSVLTNVHKASIEEIKAGRIPETRFPQIPRPRPEAGTDYNSAKANWLENQKKLFPEEFRLREMEKELVEKDVPTKEIEDLINLPWPEEYMKNGLPKGVLEHGPRNALRQFDEALVSVRKAARLTDLMSREPLEIKLVGKEEEIVKLPPEPGFEGGEGQVHKFEATRGGKLVGEAQVIPMNEGKLLYIDWIDKATGTNPLEASASMLEAGREIRKVFPNATETIGYRITGAQRGLVRRPLTDLALHEIAFGEVPKGWEYVEGREKLAPQLKLDKPQNIPAISVSTKEGLKRYQAKSVGTLTMKAAFQQFNFAAEIPGPLGEAVRGVAQAVTDKGGHVPIHFIKDADFDVIIREHPSIQGTTKGENIPAFYDPSAHQIIFRESSLTKPFLGRDVLHEAIHAVTSRALTHDTVLDGKIQKLLDHVKKVTQKPDQYGLTNTHEFLAELVANPAFQHDLMNMTVPKELLQEIGPVRGFLRSAWDIVINLIADSLGLKGDKEVTALEAGLRLTQKTIDRPFSLQEKMNLGQWRQALDTAPLLRPAVRSMEQIDKVRSFSRLQDRLAEQAGDLIKGSQKEGATKFDNLRYLHNAIVNHLGLEKRPDLPPNIAELAKKLDPDDVRNYMDAYRKMNSEEFASLVEHVNTREGTKKEVRAEHTKDLFAKVFDAIEEMKAMSERTESPTLQPGAEYPPETPLAPPRPGEPIKIGGRTPEELADYLTKDRGLAARLAFVDIHPWINNPKATEAHIAALKELKNKIIEKASPKEFEELKKLELAREQDEGITSTQRSANIWGTDKSSWPRGLMDWLREGGKSIAGQDVAPPKTLMAPPRQPELPQAGTTRMEHRKAFKTPAAAGMTKDFYDKYQKLIDKQRTEDAKRRMEYLLEQAQKQNTTEWKENFDRIYTEVEESVRNNPDFLADEALRLGTLDKETDPPKVGRQRMRIDSDKLSEEQKKVLDPSEHKSGGMNPDDFASFFRFNSADGMIERLAGLRQFLKDNNLKPDQLIKNIALEETERRMQAEYGDLGKNILDQAEDAAMSATEFDKLHEETIALATSAGLEFSLTKEQVKEMVKRHFDSMPVGQVDVADFLRLSGKHGLAVEKALLEGDFQQAFRSKQAQFFALTMAKEAKAVEKAQATWDRNAKRFAKRKVAGVDQRYTNAIHDIMFRTGSTHSPRRTAADLADAFRRDGWSAATPLRDFFDNRYNAFRELAIPDWLMDPTFTKEFDKLTVKEFREANDAIKSLIKNGRDENTVFRDGEKVEILETLQEMRDSISDLPIQKEPIDRLEPRRSRWTKSFFWSLINIESIMNRLDRGKADGLFKKLVTQMVTEGMNTKDAMLKKYQEQLNEVAKISDMDKKVENNLLIDSQTGEPHLMRRRNALGVLQIAGDQGALKKFLKGHNVEQPELWDWLRRNTKPEDWDRAEKIGKIFDDLFEQASRMQHELSGVAPVKTPRGEFVDPFGRTRQSWYNPIRYDRQRAGKSPNLIGRSAAEEEGYARATVPTGYLEERTGYSAEFDMNLDIVPTRMRQMIHDISMRPAIIQASKLLYHPEFDRMMRKYMGKHATDELIPWLRDVANSPNYMSHGERIKNELIEFYRVNMISTLIGLNPGTVAKHGLTALANSMQQVGYRAFAHELATLLNDSGEGSRNWTMARDKSEEIQRRFRNFQELIRGHGVELKLHGGTGKFDTFRELAINVGAAPVAFFDLMSTVPTWLVKYKEAKLAGKNEGQAIFEADLAVRQTHGSASLSNKPRVMREGGPLQQTFASLYGFFSHMFQKQYEMAWRAKDMKGEFSEGEYKAGLKQLPILTGMFLSYVIVPAVIEEIVTPYTNSERDSWGAKAAKTLAFGISSSTIGLRDFIHALINVRDPQPGLLSTEFKAAADAAKDVGKSLGGKRMSVTEKGRALNHAITFFGLMTGLAYRAEGNVAEYVYRLFHGQEKGPEGIGDILMTIPRKGTLRKKR